MARTGWRARRGGRLAPWLLAATAIVLILMLGAALPAAAGAAKPRPHLRTIARGLDNPRGLVFLSRRRLAVAEAGHAGTVCLGPGMCLGTTGRVSVVDTRTGARTQLVTGLPSFGGPFGAFGLGGLAVQRGALYSMSGLNPQSLGPALCTGQPDVTGCTTLVTTVQGAAGLLNQVRAPASGGLRMVAPVGRFDFDYAAAHRDPGNPEYAPGDANPFGLTARPRGGFYVVDAASNTLDVVSPAGVIRVLASVPDPPNHRPIYDAAPTCAARTPNGDVFVATESHTVWRWNGRRLRRVLSGGKVGQVVGCVADRRGNLYLANLASRIRGTFPNFNEKPFDGSIVKVRPDLSTRYLARRLNLPSGLAIGPDGHLYVALNGLCPSELSLLTSQNAPAGACPQPGRVVRFSRR